MEVDICIRYGYFVIVTATDTGPDDLPDDRITCLGIQLYGLHIQHISQHRNAFLSHAQPRVSMRIHTCPHTSIYPSLI